MLPVALILICIIISYSGVSSKSAVTQDSLELWGVIIQKTEFVQLLINDLHDVLGYSALLQPLSELLLDGVLVLLLEAQLFFDDLQLLLQEVFPVRLFDFLLYLQQKHALFNESKRAVTLTTAMWGTLQIICHL